MTQPDFALLISDSIHTCQWTDSHCFT